MQHCYIFMNLTATTTKNYTYRKPLKVNNQGLTTIYNEKKTYIKSQPGALSWSGDTLYRVAILSLSHHQFKILSQNPDLKYYFISVLNMSLNLIQSWPEFNLSYPQNFNFIHLSLQKINFILLSRNCVGTPLSPRWHALLFGNDNVSTLKVYANYI